MTTAEGAGGNGQAKRRSALTARFFEPISHGVRGRLRRRTAYSSLVAERQARLDRNRDVVWSVVAVVLSTGLAGFLWVRPVSGPVRLSFAVTGDRAHLRLRETWAMADDAPFAARPSSFRMRYLSRMDGAVLGTTIESSERDGWLEVASSRVRLSGVRLEAGAELLVEARPSEPEKILFVRNGGFDASVSLWGPGRFTAGVGSDAFGLALAGKFEPPETIDCHSGPGQVPLTIRFQPARPWQFRNLAVSGIDFSWDRPTRPGVVDSESTVRSGTLLIETASRAETLREGDRLVLGGLQGRVAELKVHDAVEMAFEGTANVVRVGPEGFERDLKPRWLKYLRGNQPLAMWFGAAGFIWTQVWAFKRGFQR